jgi:hypothetical protein
MPQVKMSEDEYREIEERKKRENPTPTVQYSEPIGPTREESTDAGEYEDVSKKSKEEKQYRREHPRATIQYQEDNPPGPQRPSKLQQWGNDHLTPAAQSILAFPSGGRVRQVQAVVHKVNAANIQLGSNTGRSPASLPAMTMPFANRGGYNPFISPFSAPAPRRQTKTQRRDERRQQRVNTGVPGWVMGTGPAPWTNQKTTTTTPKKKKKQPRQTQARMPSWIMPGKPSWLRF